MTQACYETHETHKTFSLKIMDTGISFLCIWNIRGWQQPKELLQSLLKKLAKSFIQYINHLPVPAARKNQNERDKKKISSISYLEWLIKHEEHCVLNHVGNPQSTESSAVMTRY